MYSFSAGGIKTQDQLAFRGQKTPSGKIRKRGTRVLSNTSVFSFQFALACGITTAV